MKKKISVSLLIVLCIFAAFFGKIVRYTFMENVLVNNGIGWHFIKYLNNNDTSFAFTIHNTETKDNASAEDNTIFFFDKINILGLSTYYGFEIYISIIYNIIIFILLYKYKKSYSQLETIIILMSIAALNIFSFCLAKEPVQMLYFLLMYLILRSKNNSKFLKCFLVFLLSTITFRNYYIIMAFYMVVLFYLIKYLLSKVNKVKTFHIFLILLTIFGSFFMILSIIKYIKPDSFNELLRVRLRTADAKTDIRAIFTSTNLWIFSFNYLLTVIRMVLPLELLFMGPKYYIYVLYQVIITCIVINNIKGIRYIDNTRKTALIIFISFILGSATFEPDFGSWIRHETVLFPILLYLIQPIKKDSDEEVKTYA